MKSDAFLRIENNTSPVVRSGMIPALLALAVFLVAGMATTAGAQPFNVTGDDVCEGDSTVVGLDGSQEDHIYTLFHIDGAGDIESEGASIIAGSTGPISFPPVSESGKYIVHEYTPVEFGVRQDPSEGVRQNGEVFIFADPLVRTLQFTGDFVLDNGEAIFADDGSVELINSELSHPDLGAQWDVAYRLLEDGTPVQSPQTGDGGTLAWTGLPPGTYTVEAVRGGCDPVQMDGALVVRSGIEELVAATTFTLSSEDNVVTAVETLPADIPEVMEIYKADALITADEEFAADTRVAIERNGEPRGDPVHLAAPTDEIFVTELLEAAGIPEENLRRPVSDAFGDPVEWKFTIDSPFDVATDITVESVVSKDDFATHVVLASDDTSVAFDASTSTYAFDFDVPAQILENIDVDFDVTFKTDEEDFFGIPDVRFEFEAHGPGDVTFTATDSEDNTHTETNEGYWGPSSGFDLPAAYEATTTWTLNFSAPGSYDITFNAHQVGDEESPFAVDSANVAVTATYVLDITFVGEGAVDLDPEPVNGVYADGTEVALTAQGDPFWRFDSWSGDATGTSSPTTVTMDGDKGVTATFVEAPVFNEDSGESFATIQSALDAAGPGDTVQISAGTYMEDLNINKDGLTISGAGMNQVTIDADGQSGWGIDLTGADGVTLEGFTLIRGGAADNRFGIHTQPVGGPIQDLTIVDVRVTESGRTGFDLNGINNLVLNGVVADNNSGAGIALTDVTNALIDSVETSANAWGGLAIWTSGSGDGVDPGTANITVSNSLFTEEPTGLYTSTNAGSFDAIVLENNEFAVNAVQVADQTGLDALDMETILAANTFDRAVAVRGSAIKVPAIYSSIQDGIDAAEAGDIVDVAAGMYEESVTIDVTGLTLQGPNAGTAGNDPARDDEAIVDGQFKIATGGIHGVTIDGFSFESDETAGIVRTPNDPVHDFAVVNNRFIDIKTEAVHTSGASGPDYQNWEISGNAVFGIQETKAVFFIHHVDGGMIANNFIDGRFDEGGDYDVRSRGIQLDGVNDVLVENNTVENVGDQGIQVAGVVAVASNVTITGNTVTQTGQDRGRGGVRLYHENLENIEVTGNTLESNALAIEVRDSSGAANDWVNLVFEENIISGNTFGVDNPNSGVLDAALNWWGHSSGPGGEGPGEGDAISENVAFDPWYSDDGLTTLATEQPILNLTAGTSHDTIGDAVAGLTPNDELQVSDPFTVTDSNLLPSETTDSELAEFIAALTPLPTLNANLDGMDADQLAAVNGNLGSFDEITGEAPVTLVRAGSTVGYFTAIQSAINAAEVDDTIEVGSGTYEEEVFVDVNGLTLRSVEGPLETTIAYSVGGGANEDAPVAIAANDVRFEGFTVSSMGHSNSRAIRIRGTAGDVTVTDNILIDTDRGIQGDWGGKGPSTGLTIDGNIFTGIARGIAGTEGWESPTITNNVFEDIDANAISLGVGVTDVVVTGNDFTSVGGRHFANYDPDIVLDILDILEANTFDLAAAVDLVSGSIQEAIYSTMSQAIAEAAAGAEVTVIAGTYDENLLIDKALSLIGPNAGVSAVTGSREPEAVLTEPINISATNDVTVSGFEFFEVAAGNAWTVYIYGDSDNFTFENNRFVDIDRGAIRSGDGSQTGNLTVVGNLIEGMTTGDTGLRFGGIHGVSTISNNRIDLAYNGIPTGYMGILTSNASDLTISGNEIFNTTHQGLQLSGACSDVIIENNLISNTNTSQGADRGAIRLYGTGFTGPVTITGNTLSNSFNGIAVRDGGDIEGKDIVVHNNVLSGNSNYGAYNGGTGILLATLNYWGSADGPSGEGSGSGDVISANVAFDPWYADEAMTVLATDRAILNLTAGTSHDTIGDAVAGLTPDDDLQVSDPFTVTAANLLPDDTSASELADFIAALVAEPTLNADIDDMVADQLAAVNGNLEEFETVSGDAPVTLVRAGAVVGYFIVIQSAVNAADEDDVIEVLSGTYTESIEILTNGLTLLSTDGAATTIIDADGATNGIAIGDHDWNTGGTYPTGVTVDGFTVTGWDERGISQRNGTGTVFIRDNILEGPLSGSRNGINLSGGTGSQVTGNVITTSSFDQDDWSGTGILLMGSIGALVDDNTVVGADLGIVVAGYPDWVGIDPSWEEAAGNTISNNDVSGSGSGIALAGAAMNTTITGNTISDNDRGVNEFPQLGGVPGGNVVEDNTFTGNDWGIRVSSSLENEAAYDPAMVITGNDFADSETFHIRDFSDTQDVVSLVANNSFDKSVYISGIAHIAVAIQTMIDAADEGDTITVAAGLYEEDLDVQETSGLTLLGARAGESAGPGAARDADSTGDESIVVGEIYFGGGTPTVEGLTIDGFRFEDTGLINNGARIDGSLVITNSIIHSQRTYYMISVGSGSGHTLELSHSNVTGGRGFSIGNAQIASALISNNVFNTTAASVISGSAQPGVATVEDNVFNSPRGLNIVQSGNTITGNTFNVPAGSENRGIDLYESEDNVITGNVFAGDGLGMLLRDGTGARQGIGFAGNTIESNTFGENSIFNATNTDALLGGNTIDGDDLGEILVVAGGGVADPGVLNLTSGTPFFTIQAAIDAADAGDVIEVAAGEVFDLAAHLEVTVEDLTLTTDSGDPALLRYAGDDFFPVMEIFAEGVTVENFLIERNDTTNTGGQAIAIRKANVTIQGNTITGSDANVPAITIDHGLPGEGYAESVSGIVVTDNLITGDFAWGILVRSQNSDGQITGGEVTDNVIDITGGAVAVFQTHSEPDPIGGLVLEDNVIGKHVTQLFDNTGGVDFAAFIANNILDGAVVITESGQIVEDSGVRRIRGTIQSAVDVATGGQTVEVAAATYEESVTIDVTDLTLQGPNAGIAGDDAARVDEAVVDGQFKIATGGVHGVTIDGFSFESDETAGIVRTPNDPVHDFAVVNNRFIDIKTEAVHTSGATAPDYQNWEISGNAVIGIQETKAAFFIHHLDGGIIANNVVDGRFDEGGDYGVRSRGIQLDGVKNVLVENNTVDNVGDQGIQVAGAVSLASNITITGNTVTKAGQDRGRGGVRLYHEGLENVSIIGNTLSNNELGIEVRDSSGVANAWVNLVVEENIISGNNFGVDNPNSGILDAAKNYWGAPDGPSGAGGGNGDAISARVNYVPFYVDAAMTELSFGAPNDDSTFLVDQTIEEGEDLVIGGTLTIGDDEETPVTVVVRGTLTAQKLDLKPGAVLQVINGTLVLSTVDDGEHEISGTFTVFNSWGSIHIDDDTSFSGDTLMLISDIHVSENVTLTVTGSLVLDGSVMDSVSGRYNLVVEEGATFRMARTLLANADVQIDADEVEIFDNLLDDTEITVLENVGEPAAIFHNVLNQFGNESTIDIASGAQVVTEVDGWGDVAMIADTENNLLIDATEKGLDPGRTLENGNLYIQPTDTVIFDLDVDRLLEHKISGVEAMLGFSTDFFNIPGDIEEIDPWTVNLMTDWSTGGLGVYGQLDAGIGLDVEYPDPDGTQTSGTVLEISLDAAGKEGLTTTFFRLKQDGDTPGMDTRLTASDEGTPFFLTPFTLNTGLIVIDGTDPEIDNLLAIQEQNGVDVDVFDVNTKTRQGFVEFTVEAFDELAGIADEDVILEISLQGDPAVTIQADLVDTEPVTVGDDEWTRYVFSAEIDETTVNGVYDVTAEAWDRSGNANQLLDETLTVDKNQIGVVVELEGVVDGPLFREVVFTATDAQGAMLEQWVRLIEFDEGVGVDTLFDVPLDMVRLSAKAEFSLRRRLPAEPDLDGQVGVVFGGAENLLLSGDITGDNVVNMLDFSVLRSNWLSENGAADITGSGGTTIHDLNLIKANWYVQGDEL